MKCGYSKKCINPPIGIPIAGSYEIAHSKDIIDDLHARAVAFSDGETSSVIISVDLCHMETEEQNLCRKRISDKTGIDQDAILILCTHTHAGPYSKVTQHVIDLDPTSVPLINGYVQFLTEQIVESAIEAYENLLPSKLFSASGKAENVSNVRRYLMKDGTTITNPGVHNPDILSPLGEPNNTVKLLKVVREGGKDLYIVNFGMHATTVHGRTYISADYPGVVCATLEKALDAESMFIQSAEGDVVQINTLPSKEILELNRRDDENLSKNKLVAIYSGQVIAGEVLKIHNLAKEVTDGSVAFKKCELKIPSNKTGGNYADALKIDKLYQAGRHHELPYEGMALVTLVANAQRIIRMQNEPNHYTYYAHVVSVGDYAFVGLPGEPFTEIRNRIDASSAFSENTIVCALTNCSTQYFPSTKAFSEGGYEVATTSIGPGSDDVVVDVVNVALKELKNTFLKGDL